MWDRAPSLIEQEWKEALSTLHIEEFSREVRGAAQHAVFASKRFNEIYIGGDGTSCMLQIIAASGDEGGVDDTDILGSVLIPSEEVRIAYTARGAEVYAMICSFWAWSPSSPALLSCDGTYHRLACKVENSDWTEGFLCPAHMKVLQLSEDATVQNADAMVSIYVPGRPASSPGGSPESYRAAIPRNTLPVEDSKDDEMPRRTRSIADFAEVASTPRS